MQMNTLNNAEHLTTDEKRERLIQLGQKRKKDQWERYKNIADIHDGAYDRDHDHVSPITKGANNLDSKIMVILQDWASEEDFIKPFDPNLLDNAIGYAPSSPTIKNLKCRLHDHFNIEINETYATNLFPFIKPGRTSAAIPYSVLKRAARDYAVPQIAIVRPLLVIVLGHLSFWAIAEALEQKAQAKLKDSIQNPIDQNGYRIWCQAHTAWDAAKLGGLAAVDAAWAPMAVWYKRSSRGQLAATDADRR